VCWRYLFIVEVVKYSWQDGGVVYIFTSGRELSVSYYSSVTEYIQSVNKVPKYIRHAARNAEEVSCCGYWCHVNVIARFVILMQNSASMNVSFTAGFRQKPRKLQSPDRQSHHEISELFSF